MASSLSPYLSIYPGVLKAGEGEKKITVHVKHNPYLRIFDVIQNIRYWHVDSKVIENTCGSDPIPYERNENGDLSFLIKTPLEGEYAIAIEYQRQQGNPQKIMLFVYALNEDLFRLRPWKGDFHMHSTRSDGAQDPDYVAATCRKTGFDFMSLTDHKKYGPSLEARAFISEFENDMLVIPGEEVHLPDNPVHIVNFGGNSSINELAYSDEEKYRREVQEYMTVQPCGYDDTVRFAVASSEWVFDRIRDAGGIGMFCHPYWRPQNHGFIQEGVVELLMEHNRFDVLEVFGGFYEKDVECNMLSFARWQEERAKGRKIPVAGISDSHNCDGDLAGWYYTVIFAEKLEFGSLAEAIRDERSVAVHWIPGHAPVAAGTFRLVKFVYFLLREYYPQHDALCAVEGDLLRRYLAGEEPEAKAILKNRKGTVGKYMEQFWEQETK